MPARPKNPRISRPFARFIGPVEFFVRARMLEHDIRDRLMPEFGAMLAIKRSGWVLGAQLSHATGLPVFAEAEIGSIPDRLGGIIVVDTVAWTGRSIRRAVTALGQAGFGRIATAVMFIKSGKPAPFAGEFLAQDTTDVVPRFFFQKGFRFDLSSDPEYIEAASTLWSSPLGE